MNVMRQIILDIETTGLEHSQGHKIIEVGAIEMINRQMTDNKFHHYINPKREIDAAATDVHGIRNEDLKTQPVFEDLATELLEFIKGAELIIHNAPFDVGFLEHEFNLVGLGSGVIKEHCQVVDTLVMARHQHPGQKNSLDALCRRYHVDNARRTLHGALLDAEILADVYLQMTGGQTTLLSETESMNMQSASGQSSQYKEIKLDPQATKKLTITTANTNELKQHDKWLTLLRQKTKNNAIWDKLISTDDNPA